MRSCVRATALELVRQGQGVVSNVVVGEGERDLRWMTSIEMGGSSREGARRARRKLNVRASGQRGETERGAGRARRYDTLT